MVKTLALVVIMIHHGTRFLATVIDRAWVTAAGASVPLGPLRLPFLSPPLPLPLLLFRPSLYFFHPLPSPPLHRFCLPVPLPTCREAAPPPNIGRLGSAVCILNTF